jgi:transcriptional regulator with XRE-family HTH domain
MRSPEDLEYYKQLGQRLRALRTAMQLSEAQAAALAGVTQKTYRRCEAGKPVLTVKYLLTYCRRSGVAFGYLMGEEGCSVFASDTGLRH